MVKCIPCKLLVNVVRDQGGEYPFNTQRGVKVYIDFDQDGFFNPNTENVLPLAFQGTGTGWTPTYNVFNVMIPTTAQTGTTHMRVVYSRLGTVPFFAPGIRHASRDV